MLWATNFNLVYLYDGAAVPAAVNAVAAAPVVTAPVATAPVAAIKNAALFSLICGGLEVQVLAQLAFSPQARSRMPGNAHTRQSDNILRRAERRSAALHILST